MDVPAAVYVALGMVPGPFPGWPACQDAYRRGWLADHRTALARQRAGDLDPGTLQALNRRFRERRIAWDMLTGLGTLARGAVAQAPCTMADLQTAEWAEPLLASHPDPPSEYRNSEFVRYVLDRLEDEGLLRSPNGGLLKPHIVPGTDTPSRFLEDYQNVTYNPGATGKDPRDQGAESLRRYVHGLFARVADSPIGQAWYNNNARWTPVCDLVAATETSQFHVMYPDRHQFAFRNGVYDAAANAFHPHTVNHPGLHPIQYFNEHFDPAWLACPLADIPTQDFESIPRAQDQSPAALEMHYVMFGRMIYSNGERDTWQVYWIITGKAGTGKSTIMKAITNLYPQQYVGILSNRMEEMFGLQGLLGAHIAVGAEIKPDWTMNQAVFQQMVTGEVLPIAVKNRPAVVIRWLPHVALASNDWFERWSDARGSLIRRTVLTRYMKTVVRQDTGIEERIRANMGPLIARANRTYLAMVDACREHHQGSLDDIMAGEFNDTRLRVILARNPLDQMLRGTGVVLGPERRIPMDRLCEAHNRFVQQKHFRPTAWESDYYETPFRLHGLHVEGPARGQYRQSAVTDLWVVGVDLAE